MLKLAFLLLTLNEAGDPRLTVSYTASMEDCEALGFTILGILDGMGSEILAERCGETPLSLTPFAHGLGPEHEVNRYRVTIPQEAGWVIEPLAAGAVCEPAPEASPAVYCATSVQAVIE
ncbi:MAG: hypothetical protein ACK5JR_00665 [Tropicimonas sp.]|uniref:hypothetical protein n=1 Tax=Tropicimonas sp. TaxID=2067044 RepID=UPI003A8850DA